MQDMCLASSALAAATFAAIINSSIKRWLSKPAREADMRHRAVVRERDNAFRQVEIERAAALPRCPERAVDAVERGDRSLHRPARPSPPRSTASCTPS